MSLALGALAGLLAGCGSRSGLYFFPEDAAPHEDAAPDAEPFDAAPPPPDCKRDADCDDLLYCNGPETCVDTRCAAGVSPCPAGDPCTMGACDEPTDGCSLVPLDADLDGHQPLACAGDDCDDSNAAVYENALEVCDYLDNDCHGEVDEGFAYVGLGSDLNLSVGFENAQTPTLRYDGADFDAAFDTWPSGISEVHYVAVAADGASASAPAIRADSPVLSSSPALEWTGSEYGMFFHYHPETEDRGAIGFRRLDADGDPLADVLILTNADPDKDHPAAAWSGARYGVAHWAFPPDGDHFPIYFMGVSGAGAVEVEGWELSRGHALPFVPSVAWTGASFAASFVEDGALVVAMVDADAESVIRRTTVSSDGGQASVVWNGSELGVAYGETDGTGPLHFEWLDGDGDIVSGARIEGTESATGVDLLWSGGVWAVTYQEEGADRGHFLVRIAEDIAWTSSPGLVSDDYAWDGPATSVTTAPRGYGVAYREGSGGLGTVRFRLAGCP